MQRGREHTEHAVVEVLIGLTIVAVGIRGLDYRAPDFGGIMFCLLGAAVITKGIVDFMR